MNWQYIEPWLQLSLISGLGPKRQKQLINKLGNPQTIISLPKETLAKKTSVKLADRIHSYLHNPDTQKQLKVTHQWVDASPQHHIITLDDPFYPEQLKTIADPPLVLYIYGDPHLLSDPQIAVVGSRQPTLHGKKIARQITQELCKSGLVITSGIALGIDAIAHQTTVSQKGQTIALLGTGIDQVYPRQNQQLFADITNNGALVSEFPLGTPPAPGHFPKRNRLIAGLSLGTVVIEAAVASGSLITAKLALEQGREVFAVPGPVASPLSRGCHQLIREGAILTENARHIIEELQPLLKTYLKDNPILLNYDEKSEENCVQNHPPSWQAIHSVIGYDIVSTDELMNYISMEYEQLLQLLTEMEIAGVIQAVSGGYQRN